MQGTRTPSRVRAGAVSELTAVVDELTHREQAYRRLLATADALAILIAVIVAAGFLGVDVRWPLIAPPTFFVLICKVHTRNRNRNRNRRIPGATTLLAVAGRTCAHGIARRLLAAGGDCNRRGSGLLDLLRKGSRAGEHRNRARSWPAPNYVNPVHY
ncbi:MAG: hypothetical protein ACLP01_05930 [Solirubrobacteraceae bacterium]